MAGRQGAGPIGNDAASTRGRTALAHGLIGGLIGLDAIGRQTALAALVFAGPLSLGQSPGLMIFLLTTAVASFALVLSSQIPNAISVAQDAPLAILAPAIAVVIVPLGLPIEAKVMTALAALGLSSVLLGVGCLVGAQARLSALVRILPFPVIAGFLTSTGVLLLETTLRKAIAAGAVAPGAVPLSGEALWLPLAAVGFAVSFFATRRLGPPLLSPLVFVAAIIGFYALSFIAGVPESRWEALGFLRPHMDTSGPIYGLSPPLIDMQALIALLPAILTASFVAMAAHLITFAGVELSTKRDADAGRALRVTGGVNAALGLIGGPPSYLSSSATMQAEGLGARSRIVPVVVALVCLAAIFQAEFIAHVIPQFVQLGLLLCIGTILVEVWLVRQFRRLPRVDWAIILAIVAVNVRFGFPVAIGFGLLIATTLFAVRYGRVPVIARQGDGQEFRSTVDRSPQGERQLRENRTRLHGISLQGYLFFGSVDQILRAVRAVLMRDDPPAAVVLDFRKVVGIDPTVCASLAKLAATTRDKGAEIHATGMLPSVRQVMERAGLEAAGFTLAESLDTLLERLEDGFLEHLSQGETERSVPEVLAALLGEGPGLTRLIAAMEVLDLADGALLTRAGAESGDVFIVSKGRIGVHVPSGKGERVRVRSMGQGAVVGEMALYSGGVRSADAQAEGPAQVYVLTQDKVHEMETQDPEVAILIHKLMAISLSEKLSRNNAALVRQ